MKEGYIKNGKHLKKNDDMAPKRSKARKSSRQNLAECIEGLKKEKPYESVAERIEKILKFHIDVKDGACGKIDASEVFPDDIQSRIERGELMADLTRLKVDESFFRRAILKLCKILKSQAKQKSGGIEDFVLAVNEGKVDFTRLQHATVKKGDYFSLLHRELGLDPLTIFSLSMNAYRPIFEAVLEGSGEKFDESKWGKGDCPACGSLPVLSRLEKETGKRHLWCATCNSEWTFKRLKCPFCGNEDQNSLEYFYLEDDSPYRVDVCRECRGYLKTVDENKGELGEVWFLMEDIKTSYLDLLAEKEGFKKIILGGVE